MNPDKQFVVDVMNTPSSDYLKAAVLNKLAGMDIDLTRTKLPPGAASDAFAKAKMAAPRLSSSIPLIAPVEDAPSPRMSSVPMQAMPATVKFEDKDPPSPAAVEAARPEPAPAIDGEQDIDGKSYVTIARAAQLRRSSVGAAYQAASAQAWAKVRSKKLKGVVYLKDDVLEGIKDKN